MISEILKPLRGHVIIRRLKNNNMQVEKVTAHIVGWLKQYAEEAKMDGFVIGVSGGVDSAVTSTLCAMTGLKTLCVEMPIHQAKGQVGLGCARR